MKINGKHRILVAALSAAALCGCSGNEDVPNAPAEKGGCTFTVSVEDGAANASRAYGANPDADIITKDNFKDRCPFFPIRIHRNDNGGWGVLESPWLGLFNGNWHLAKLSGSASSDAVANHSYSLSDFVSSPEYWNTNITDFYAIAGFANEYRWEGIPQPEYDAAQSNWHVRDINMWNSNNVDFLWTARREQRTADQWAQGNVNLVFNHALSRLRFTVRNANKNLRVEVRDIYVGNIYRCASFSLTNARNIYMGSDLNRDLPAAHNNVNASNLGQLWYDYKFKAKADLRSGMKSITLDGVSGTVTAESSQGGEYAFLVIPQTVKRWDPTNAGCVALTASATSADYSYPGYDNRYRTNNLPGFLVINCVIRDRNTGVVLWETRNFDNESTPSHQENGAYNTDFERMNGVILPLTPAGSESFTWLPSRSYTYNIVFGEGAGWDSEGDPTLVPIRMTASVAAFNYEDKWLPAN